MAAPAGATARPSVEAIVVHGATYGHIGPNSNLKLKNDVLKFAPKTLNVTVKPGKCKTTSYEYSITNKTTASQPVTLDGQTWETLSPSEQIVVCSGVGQITFAVPGTPATLTVNSSGGA
jgi:hypothetical protein